MSHLTLHVSVAALALSMFSSSGHQPALRLRIQALNQDRPETRVTVTTSAEQGRARSAVTVVETPAVLPIADSIQSIRILVRGVGAVRATLTDSENPGKDLLVVEGRDLTLSRDAQGRFYRDRMALIP
jgi:uncharacterized protein YfaP (DUF2135 family)